MSVEKDTNNESHVRENNDRLSKVLVIFSFAIIVAIIVFMIYNSFILKEDLSLSNQFGLILVIFILVGFIFLLIKKEKVGDVDVEVKDLLKMHLEKDDWVKKS